MPFFRGGAGLGPENKGVTTYKSCKIQISKNLGSKYSAATLGYRLVIVLNTIIVLCVNCEWSERGGLLESSKSIPMPDDPASSATARQLAEDHYYAALDLVLEGRHEQAVEEYRQAVEADPRFTDALHGLSRALQDLNRLRRSNRCCPTNLGDRSRRYPGAHQPLDPVSEKGNGPRGRGGGEQSAGAGVEAAVAEGEWIMAALPIVRVAPTT